MSAKLPSIPLNSQDFPVEPSDCLLSAFSAFLEAQGYSATTLRSKIQITRNFCRWLLRRRMEVSDLEQRTIALFFEENPRAGHINRGDLSTLCSFLEWLRNGHQTRPLSSEDVTDDKISSIKSDFARYLREERGLSPATLSTYLPLVHSFLTECFGSNTVVLAEIGISEITRFIFRRTSSSSCRYGQVITSALRGFFRFLRYRGDIVSDLAAAVPTVANWKRSEIPKYLTHEDVERLLQHCDRTTVIGRRDVAALLLLARLGLRAGEVVAMVLDDIDWETGVITIRGKGRRRDQLPIPQEVGEALVAYLLHGRPQGHTRRVFLRAKAPIQGFTSSAAIDDIVRRALTRAGLDPIRKGAHLLRHSLATSMLRQGASLTEIGEILRHSTPNTTEIYAKVNIAALSALAQPWPGGEA
jgi:site-specific recombinase XerD